MLTLVLLLTYQMPITKLLHAEKKENKIPFKMITNSTCFALFVTNIIALKVEKNKKKAKKKITPSTCFAFFLTKIVALKVEKIITNFKK